MEIITITNQKGGVGKTTTAQHLAIGLKQRGYKVLLVDADQQTNLSYTLNWNYNASLYEVITKVIPTKEAIFHSSHNVFVSFFSSPTVTEEDKNIIPEEVKREETKKILKQKVKRK